MASNWSHESLLNDLADHLAGENRMVWRDMQLGPSGSPRPDVYTITKSYVKPCFTAYECKISREDFRSDVTSGKWQAYLRYSYSVVFAVPAGLVDKREVPEMCGLIVRHDASWRIAKKATINPVIVDQQAMLKLIIDGVTREGPKVRTKHWNQYDAVKKFSAKFGARAGKIINDLDTAEANLKFCHQRAEAVIVDAHRRADEINQSKMREAPELYCRLLTILGLPDNSSTWAIRDAIRKIEVSKIASDVPLDTVLNKLRIIIETYQSNGRHHD